MPDLNLKDEEEFSDDRSREPQAPRKSRFHGSGGGDGSNKILLVAIVILIILGVVMLNQFGVINLWGTGDSRVVVDLPPLEDEIVDPLPEPRELELTPIPEEVEPAEEIPPPVRERQQPREVRPAGTGQYTVQVSAWRDRQKAETQVNRIRDAGKDAFIDQATINGVTWYQVRIGRYQTREEAEAEANNFQLLLETGWWVARIDN
jgi:hypothetical protein